MARFDDVLLTVDYDRTLTAPDSTIPQRNLEAIRYFMENGGRFTVNTGRSIPMAKIFWDKVPVNAPLLLYNGSAAYDLETHSFTFVHEIPLDPRVVIPELLELFPDLILEIQGEGAHMLYTPNRAWEAFSEAHNVPWCYVTPGQEPRPFMKITLYGPFRGNKVASLFDADPRDIARMDRAEQLLRSRYGAELEVFRSAPLIIDTAVKGASKGRSAQELKKQLGKKVLVCVGDAHNDLTMLESADYAFCPCDGAIADRFPNVCKCADGAVADVIYEKIPEIIDGEP